MTHHPTRDRSTHRVEAPPSPRGRPVLRLLAGAGGLIVVALALWWSGKALPPPSTLDERGLADWLGGTDPVVAAFALVRLAGLALTGWIAVTGAVSLVVHLSRLRRVRWLRRLIDRLCLPVVRRLVHGVAGVTLAAATMAPGAAGALATPGTAIGPVMAGTAAIVTVDTQPPLAAPVRTTDRAVIVNLDPIEKPPPTSTPMAAPTNPPAPSSSPVARAVPTTTPEATTPEPTPPSVAGQDPTTDTWEIRPGDHLWHVARATLDRRFGSPPPDDSVAAYLDVLIEANRDRLIVPDNPDLVFAGQAIALPPTPAALPR